MNLRYTEVIYIVLSEEPKISVFLVVTFFPSTYTSMEILLVEGQVISNSQGSPFLRGSLHHGIQPAMARDVSVNRNRCVSGN
jgi:hypothetical protein